MITIMESQGMDLRKCQLSFVNMALPSLDGNAEAKPRFGGTKGLKSNRLGIDTWPTTHCSLKKLYLQNQVRNGSIGPLFCDLGDVDRIRNDLSYTTSTVYNLISFIASPKQQNPRSCKSNLKITKLRYVCNTTDLMYSAVSSITFYHPFHFQCITLKTLSSSNLRQMHPPFFFWTNRLSFFLSQETGQHLIRNDTHRENIRGRWIFAWFRNESGSKSWVGSKVLVGNGHPT